MKVTGISVLYLLVLNCALTSQLGNAQTSAGCPAEVKSLEQSLNRIPGVGCRGNFRVEESSQRDVVQHKVSYIVSGRSVFQQNLQGIEGGFLEAMPVKLGRCGGLFLNYTAGASGAYQESYLVFSTANGFRCFDLSRSGLGFFSAQDLDGDGETEIIAQKTEDESAGFPCDKFAYWARIFHFNSEATRLVEVEGSHYPKYYAKLAEGLRSGYENVRNDPTVTPRCRQVYLQLISRANKLAQSR